MLVLNNVNVFYGAIHALKGISMEVQQGEIVTLIGSNGAGKSTSLKTISGLIRPKEGTLTFEGQNLNNVKPQDIVSRGISQYLKAVEFLPHDCFGES
jgi:branched-chain amino acid transport system ATP-binding protein